MTPERGKESRAWTRAYQACKRAETNVVDTARAYVRGRVTLSELQLYTDALEVADYEFGIVDRLERGD